MGNPVGKGAINKQQELQKLTGYKLFHNHMSLELVNQFFDFGTQNFKNLDRKIRFNIFHEIANSDLNGLIFSMVWAFDVKEDEEYIDEIIAIFKDRDPKICIVELKCGLDERLRRNKHENRLNQKPSKRDIEASEKRLLYHDKKYRMNSIDGELRNKSVYRIDNTNLTAAEVANQIIEHHKLNDINTNK